MTLRTVEPVVLSSEAIDGLPWEPMPAIGTGVTHKLLWRSGDSVAGLLRLEEGGCIEAHAHRQAHHHIWVVEGATQVLGTALGPGSYVHVPPGVDHEMLNVGAGPCTFMYTYLQPAS